VQIQLHIIFQQKYFSPARHGEGEMLWSNGRRYVGTLRQGKMHGKGNRFFSSLKRDSLTIKDFQENIVLGFQKLYKS
jgi:hypothetical protein